MAYEDTPLEVEIARLRGLDLAGLQARWRSMFGRRAPAHLPKPSCCGLWPIGCRPRCTGDLDAASVRVLDRLAKTGSDKSASLPQARSVKPGTLLLREWDGVLQRLEITNLDDARIEVGSSGADGMQSTRGQH